MRDLFKYAVKRKLLVANPATEIDKRKSNNPDGHWTWTLEEVAKSREKFPEGTEMRLAIEMINALAFRRSDAIRVGLPNTYAGHLYDGRAATFLKYTQFKNRERKQVTVETPIPAELLAVIKAAKATGLKTWLIGSRGGSFTDQGFTDWFSAEMAKGACQRAARPIIFASAA